MNSGVWMKRSVFVSVLCAFGLSAGVASADVDAGLEFLEAGDVTSASEQFASAFEAGDAQGAFWLGRLFEMGFGTSPDMLRAANLYAAAADAGDAASQLRLGLMYHEGSVLLRDYAEGTRLICAASQAGLAEAQVACGMAYESGRGVEADVARATALWEAAAAQGNVAAKNLLGAAALRTEDVAEALKWFEASAQTGNAVGMLEAARILSVEPEADFVQAYVWASLATVRGHPEAAVLRDRLEARLDAAEILEAQGKARAWTQAQMQAAE